MIWKLKDYTTREHDIGINLVPMKIIFLIPEAMVLCQQNWRLMASKNFVVFIFYIMTSKKKIFNKLKKFVKVAKSKDYKIGIYWAC
jgi:hypothetical protein